MKISLQGQTAIVTGAGSPTGIGFAIAKHLFHQGAFVALGATSDRIHHSAKQLDPSGERVHPFIADLTQESEAQRVVDELTKRTGRIDILVNNAGMAQNGDQPGNTTVQQLTYAAWLQQIAMTLHTAFLMTRAVLPIMKYQRYGRIVNVSSVTGPLVSNAGSGAYGAAKGAMDGLMRASRHRAWPRRHHHQWRCSRLDSHRLLAPRGTRSRKLHSARPPRHPR